MKSISLILSATVLFSALASAQENYSLWPRRPAELEQAQRLVRQKSYDEALRLLVPFVNKTGLAGRESRHLVSSIRARRYLSPQNPHAQVHTVRRGENIERIAVANKSSADLIVLINGLLDPSDLKVGQKISVIPQNLRAELHISEREISVWDGQQLVASYDITPTPDLINGENEESKLSEKEGESNGARVPRSSMLFASCNRRLKLANEIGIGGGESTAKSKYVHMKQRDLNELSLLLGMGARVSVVRQDKLFDPFPAAEAPPDEQTNN